MTGGDRIGPRWFLAVIDSKPLTARRAARIIAGFTVLVTLAGGTLAWLTDREDFPSLGLGLWWALQTATTVGYGDVVPTNTGGRVIGTVVMLSGIGFLTVVTASVTAALIETARKRSRGLTQQDLSARLDEISARLSAIEASVAGARERRDEPPG